MILQVKTEKELIATIDNLSSEVLRLQNSIKAISKSMADRIDAIEAIKPAVIKPVKPVEDKDILKLIESHVTINYVNKLYKKGK